MSNGQFPCLLGLIVIDSTNDALRVTENAVDETKTIAHGNYYLRGDGSSDDICKAFTDAVQSHSGTNTYSFTCLFNTDPAVANISFTLDRATGTHTFGVKFANAATTFDATILGFPQTDQTPATQQASTKSSSALWIGNDIVRAFEPTGSWERNSSRALTGKTLSVSRRTEQRDILWVQENIHEKRFNEESITTDPYRALNRFLQRHAGGRRFEWNDLTANFDASAGQADEAGLTPIDEYTFDDDFYPKGASLGERLDGAPLYSFSGHLRPYVA
jgi:hypothetical protein